MPKIVDHEARRDEIAQALWRVVRRDGIPAVSVRAVAAEAGWSAGALRYYFPDQAGLLSFAMEAVSRRVSDRIAALRPTGAPLTWAIRYLEQVIPLDDERRAEFDVWFAFLGLSQAEAGGDLRQHLEPVHAGLRDLCHSVLLGLQQAEIARADLNLAVEAERLHGLIDGLSLHAATMPAVATPRRIRTLLRHHLNTLT
jgi:AcrR family transcriptional regulator